MSSCRLLDDGRLTDNQGHTVDFKNTVIIMTSNIGSTTLLDGMTDDGRITQEVSDGVIGQLRNHFRPEFLNRIDDVVLFSPLLFEEIKQIIDLLTADLENRLREHDLDLEIEDAARELIAREGYDPVYGARPLKRYLQHSLETRIGRAIVGGDLEPGSVLVVEVVGGELQIRPRPPAHETAA